MRKNVGDGDSVLRVIIGLGLLLAAAGAMHWAIVSIALVVVAMLLLYTALTQWCPLYKVLGINTRARGGGMPSGSTGRGG